eukprot:245714-Hanusia_phi.AAC.2
MLHPKLHLAYRHALQPGDVVDRLVVVPVVVKPRDRQASVARYDILALAQDRVAEDEVQLEVLVRPGVLQSLRHSLRPNHLLQLPLYLLQHVLQQGNIQLLPLSHNVLYRGASHVGVHLERNDLYSPAAPPPPLPTSSRHLQVRQRGIQDLVLPRILGQETERGPPIDSSACYLEQQGCLPLRILHRHLLVRRRAHHRQLHSPADSQLVYLHERLRQLEVPESPVDDPAGRYAGHPRKLDDATNDAVDGSHVLVLSQSLHGFSWEPSQDSVVLVEHGACGGRSDDRSCLPGCVECGDDAGEFRGRVRRGGGGGAGAGAGA